MNFYPRSPCGERHSKFPRLAWQFTISIHALLAESDRPGQILIIVIDNFYPRSPCGERPTKSDQGANNHGISIHALLAESDAVQIVIVVVYALFLSTLSLRRATSVLWMVQNHLLFLSTLSLRRATKSLLTSVVSSADFYPRSPCGERPVNTADQEARKRLISIHALLAESDASVA